MARPWRRRIVTATMHGHALREGDTAAAFVVLRFERALPRSEVASVLRALAELLPERGADVDEWIDELAEQVSIVAVPWEPPDAPNGLEAQRRAFDVVRGRGVATVWFVQTGTSLPDVDADDTDDEGDDDEEAAWSHGAPPQQEDARFPLDGYPDIIDEVDWEDFGVAVKLSGPALAGQETVLAAFHALWLAPYGGRFRNGAVTFDRAHNSAHFWVDRFAAPTSPAEQVHHLLWVIARLDEVVPVVHARFAEASMTQKFGGLVGMTREPFVLGGNPLLGVYIDDGDAAVDSWIARQTQWSDDEVAAMLRELAIEIVTAEPDDDDDDDSGHDDDDEVDLETDDVAGAAADLAADRPDDAGQQLAAFGGELLRERAAAGKLDPRAAERLLPALAVPDRHEERRQAVVEVMAALRYRPAVPALIDILDTTSIRSALDAAARVPLIMATVSALGAIADAAAIPALARVVAAPGAHNDGPRAAAAEALAACLATTPEPRHVDDAVLAELLTTICERNDGELNAEAHFAYGNVVRLLPPERRADARRKLADADTARDDATTMLARHAALLLASPTTPIDPPPRELRALLHENLSQLDFDHEYTVRNVRVALRVADLVPELVAAEDLTWLTRFAEADVRRAAHALLARIGKPLPEAPAFDRTSVQALSDRELVRRIAEPHVVGRAALIAEAARRRLAAARGAVIAACDDVIARARQGAENLLDPDTRVLEVSVPLLCTAPLEADAIALFDRMLRHSNVHVKWDIVEQAPHDERLIAAMFHVLAENWGWQAEAARTWLERFRGTPAYEAERARAEAAADAAASERDAPPQPSTSADAARRDEDIN
jgi:hypothetical protein